MELWLSRSPAPPLTQSDNHLSSYRSPLTHRSGVSVLISETSPGLVGSTGRADSWREKCVNTGTPQLPSPPHPNAQRIFIWRKWQIDERRHQDSEILWVSNRLTHCLLILQRILLANTLPPCVWNSRGLPRVLLFNLTTTLCRKCPIWKREIEICKKQGENKRNLLYLNMWR